MILNLGPKKCLKWTWSWAKENKWPLKFYVFVFSLGIKSWKSKLLYFIFIWFFHHLVGWSRIFCSKWCTHKCNLLQIKKREDLCLKLNQSLEVQLKKLIDTKNSVVICQGLYFLLYYAFANKIYFLLHGIPICAHVGHKEK